MDGVVPPATRQKPWLAGVAAHVDAPVPMVTVDVVTTASVPVNACVPVHPVLVPYSNSMVGVVPTTVAVK